MNVLATLDKELKNKNWDKGTKGRYLYLRCCELFSFDPRYNYYMYLDSFEDEITQKFRLRERKINLEDVTDFRLLCINYTPIYQELMDKLLEIPCNKVGTGHVYPEFSEPEEVYKVKADATKSDLARVKMKLKTRGYKAIDYNFYDVFERKVDKMDSEIGYKKDRYADEILEKQAVDYLQKEWLNTNARTDIETLVNRMNEVKRLFEGYGNYSYYSDAKFCINHLVNLYFDSSSINDLCLFQFKDDFEVDFVNLIPLQTDNDLAYFILEMGNSGYSFHEIEEKEAKSYQKNMQLKKERVMLK